MGLFKCGDFVTTRINDDLMCVIIDKEYENPDDGMFSILFAATLYEGLYSHNDDDRYHPPMCSPLRLSTEKERKVVLNRLRRLGKRWDSKNLRIVKIKHKTKIIIKKL